MSTTTVATPVQSCAVTQVYLATQNQPGAGALELGFMESLLSPQNRSGFNVTVAGGKGLPKSGTSCKLQLKYIKPDCAAISHNTTLCPAPDAATLSPFGTADFQFETNDIISKPFSVGESDFKCSCDGKDLTLSAAVNAKLRSIFSNTEKRLLDLAFGCLGDYCNGDPSNVDDEDTPVHTINIFNTDGNAAQPSGWWFVLDQQSKMKFTGTPIVVGGSAIKKYKFFTEYVGIGAQGTGGVQANANPGLDLRYSSEFDSWLAGKEVLPAGDYAIVYFPGTYQLVSYNDNVGEYTRNTATSFRGTIDFPNNGINYLVDYETYYDEKCHEWQVLPKATNGLFCLPDDDLCPEIVGSGRFLVKLGCGTNSCTPIC